MSLTRGCLSLLLALCVQASAEADQLVLVDGSRLEGRVLAVGPSQVAFDGADGIVFQPRAGIAQALDADGRPVDLGLSDTGKDPVAVVKTVEGAVRVRRGDRDESISIHGSAAILRDADELRTGPYGRVGLALRGGALASARSDAVLRFHGSIPALIEGKLRLKNLEALGSSLLPEGRLDVSEGEADLEHLRGRSRVICLKGRCVFQGTAGYRIEVPRQHVLDVRAEDARQPASVGASNTNAWPLRLEYGERWVTIQPGERVVLLGAPALAPPRQTAPSEPPAVVARKEPIAPPPVEPAPERREARVAGRVNNATSSFGLSRQGAAPRQVDQSEARGLTLHEDDRVRTDQGELHVEVLGAHVRLLPQSELHVRPSGGGPALRLLAGEARVTTDDKVSVGVGGGALGLLRGELTLRTNGAETHVALSQGMAGARFGEEVRAEIVAPGELKIVHDGSSTQLSIPKGAQAVPAFLGPLELVLQPERTASFSRTGDVRVAQLWGGATLRFLDPIHARIIPGPDRTELLELVEDGSRVRLSAGTYSLRRDGKQAVAEQLPPGLVLTKPATPQVPGDETRPPAQPAVDLTRRPSGKTERHELANGAIVHTSAVWGKLEVKRQAPPNVIVSGPGGELSLGPKAEVTLTREKGFSRLELGDGRFLRHEDGAGRLDTRVETSGRLTAELFGGTALHRTLEADPNTEFDLTIRRDNYVLAYVFGQAIYVERGQRVSVTQSSGLRTYVAERSGE